MCGWEERGRREKRDRRQRKSIRLKGMSLNRGSQAGLYTEMEKRGTKGERASEKKEV